MVEQPTARQIAEHAIRSAIKEIGFMDIGDVIDTKRPDLADDDQFAFDALLTRVNDLIGQAVITVTFPGSPGRKTTIGADDDAPPCTCFTTNPHAVNCQYRFWLATREDRP